MPRWEKVKIRYDSTGGKMGDVGPAPTMADVETLWAVVSLLSAEVMERNKVDLSDIAYGVQFRDTPTIKLRNYQLVLVDRSREILEPIRPAVNPDGYTRDTTVICRDTRKVDPVEEEEE